MNEIFLIAFRTCVMVSELSKERPGFGTEGKPIIKMLQKIVAYIIIITLVLVVVAPFKSLEYHLDRHRLCDH
jgi:hypothetical protein